MEIKRAAYRVMFFGLFGMIIEVLFTGSAAFIRHGNWNFMGHTSPWMFPVYGLLGVCVAPVSGRFQAARIPFLLRVFIYMLMIFAVEYIAGVIMQCAGLRVWDYSDRPLNLHGHITLTYAPAWYFLGLWVEFLHKKLDACAVVLARGLTAETLSGGE